jgi:hypothetical protein
MGFNYAARRAPPTTGGNCLPRTHEQGASAHVGKGAVRGAHAGAMRTSSAAMSADPAAAALDAIRPAVGAGTMSGGQAAEDQITSGDGGVQIGGGHHGGEGHHESGGLVELRE